MTFIKAGGFSVSDLIPSVKQPTLIIWGDNDEILPKEDKFKFVDTIANSTLRIVSGEYCTRITKTKIKNQKIKIK